MSDNLNICSGLLKSLDEDDESSRKDKVQSNKVLEEDTDDYSHVLNGDNNRVPISKDRKYSITRFLTGILKLLDEPNENSSVCTVREVKNENTIGWINPILSEDSTLSEDKNLSDAFPTELASYADSTHLDDRKLFEAFPHAVVSYAGSEIAEGGNVTYGFADINQLDYSSYTDVLWEIVCKKCFFVSESWGLQFHSCETNEDENISTEKPNRCEKCGLFLSNIETFEEHESSRKHILLLLNKKGDEYIGELYHFYCSLCKVQSLNQKTYLMHVLGEQHRSLCTDVYFHCNSYCETCQLTMDKSGRDMHLSSRIHLMQSLLKKNRFNAFFNRKFLVDKTICEVCDFNCGNKKDYLDHLASIEHTIEEIHFLIKNMDFTMCNYIDTVSEGYKCLPCDIEICSEYLLKIHCIIDDHIWAVQEYEKQIEAPPTVVAEDLTKGPFDIIGKSRRNLARIFKDFDEYLEWKAIVVTNDYCYLCNTPRKESHEQSVLHRENSEMLFYCKVCDKTFDLRLKIFHLKKSVRHKNMISEYGVEGKPNKLGILHPTWKCKVCNMSLNNNEAQIRDHLDSIRHGIKFNQYLRS